MNSGILGSVMFIMIEIEICVIGIGDTKQGGWKGVGVWGKMFGDYCALWPLCVLGYISAVVVKGACVRDCRGLGAVASMGSQEVVSV
jgi:hypothetical protein